MEHSAVRIAWGCRWCLAVPIIHEALRHSNPLKDRVRRSSYVTAHCEHSLASVGKRDLKHREASVGVSLIANVVGREWERTSRQDEADESSHLVRSAAARNAKRIEGFPGPATCNGLRVTGIREEGPRAGKRNLRPIVGLGRVVPARLHGAISEVDADQVPTKLIVFCSLSDTYPKHRGHHYQSQKPQHRQFKWTNDETPFVRRQQMGPR